MLHRLALLRVEWIQECIHDANYLTAGRAAGSPLPPVDARGRHGYSPGDSTLATERGAPVARHVTSGCALFLLSPLILAAELTSVRSYPLPDHGVLELSVPSSWKESVSRPPANLSPTIEFAPALGNEFNVQITPIWSATGDPDLNRPDLIRALVERIGRSQLDQAVETEITLKEIKGPRAQGYVFTITDRAPAKGEWKYLTAGAVGVGRLRLSFTILSNSLDSGDLDQALRMIEQSRHAGHS
jgi:hypothetical protein